VQRWFGWWVAAAAGLQVALYVVATQPGLAGTSDSVIYLHAAHTLRTAGQLLNPDGSPYRFWPPLYPLLLAAAHGAGAARLLHGACLVGGLAGWSWLGRRLLPTAAALALPWLLALSTPWLVVSKFVWGETLFLALVAAYAVALFQALRWQQRHWWIVATVLAALLPLARTAGFFLLLGVGIGLLLHRATRLGWRSVLHLAVAAVGGIAWHVYALLVAAPSVYRLNRGWAQFFSSAADYGFVLARWLLPVKAAWRPEFPLLWAALLVGFFAVGWPRRAMLSSVPTATPPDTQKLFLRLLWAMASTFVLLLLVSTTFTRSASGLYDSERYASVLVGPVLLLVLHRASAEAASARHARSWAARGVLLVLLAWVAYSGARALGNARQLRQVPGMSWTVGK